MPGSVEAILNTVLAGAAAEAAAAAPGFGAVTATADAAANFEIDKFF